MRGLAVHVPLSRLFWVVLMLALYVKLSGTCATKGWASAGLGLLPFVSGAMFGKWFKLTP
jgi:hypothetical protein